MARRTKLVEYLGRQVGEVAPSKAGTSITIHNVPKRRMNRVGRPARAEHVRRRLDEICFKVDIRALGRRPGHVVDDTPLRTRNVHLSCAVASTSALPGDLCQQSSRTRVR
jgi:hypothetical protein